MPNLGTSERGDFLADCLLEEGFGDKPVLPRDATFLGMAAGAANPELRLAKRLGVSPNRTYLLDLSYSDCEEENGVTRIAGGVFNFLQERRMRDISIITFIGAEFLFATEQRAMAFAKLVPKVLLPLAFVCIYPYAPNSISRGNFRQVGHFWYQYSGV